MSKEKIELNDINFISTLNTLKLQNIAEMISPKDKCEFVDMWEDYGELGNVAIFEIDNGKSKQRYAYGEFGRVEVGHIDLNTNKWVEPYFAYPTTTTDYGWLIGMAIYNRNYTKHGENYLEYVEDAIMTSALNRPVNSQKDFDENKALCRSLAGNFTEMKDFYREALGTIGDDLLYAEKMSRNKPVFIHIKSYE